MTLFKACSALFPIEKGNETKRQNNWRENRNTKVKYNDKVGERKDSKNIGKETEPNKDNFIRTG
jgi:hypothetical protein